MTTAQAKKIKQLLPLVEAIKMKCVDCSSGSYNEVKLCPCKDCPLFNFREGIVNFTRGKSSKLSKNASEGRFE